MAKRRLTVWYIRAALGPERSRNRSRFIKEAFTGADFTIMYPDRVRRLGGRARADITIVEGSGGSALAASIPRFEKRSGFRVFQPNWSRSRRHFKRQRKELQRIHYHLVLPDQRTWLAEWKKAHHRVFFVDRGFDPAVFYPGPEKQKTRDIVFCGNSQAFGRIHRLEAMAAAFPGRVEWNTKRMYHQEMSEFLRSGRIGWNQILRCSPVGINYRVWEVIGCELLLLCSRSSCVTGVLEDGQQAVFWDDTDDLLEKAAYYLDHHRERKRIAAAGHVLAMQEHTWAHRGRQIREIIEAHL